MRAQTPRFGVKFLALLPSCVEPFSVQIRAQSLHYPALIHEMRVLAAALLLAAVSAAREFRCRIYPPLIMARGGVPYPSLSSPWLPHSAVALQHRRQARRGRGQRAHCCSQPRRRRCAKRARGVSAARARARRALGATATHFLLLLALAASSILPLICACRLAEDSGPVLLRRKQFYSTRQR